jgi:tetratricopeptide (TPR) repeat protein
LISAAATLIAVLAAGAGPDDTVAEAKRLYDAGGQAYEQGRYRIAIDALEEAYRLAPRAPTAFSAAQAYRLQYFVDGDVRRLARAVELYRAYLDLAPDGNRREHAAQHLATLVPILERLRREGVGEGRGRPPEPARTQVIVACRTPGASVRVDDGAPEPAPAAFEVVPGKHSIHVEAAEHLPQTLDTVAVAGSVVALNVALDPQPGAVQVRAPKGARVVVDDRLVGSSPLLGPVELPPGHHQVAVTASGRRPYVRDLELGRGQKMDVEARLELTTQRWFAYGMFATGGALLIGAVATWGVAGVRASQAHDLEAKLDAMMSWTTEEAAQHTALQAQRNDLLRAGAITAAVGVAAGALGLVLWLTDKPEAPMTVIAPTVGSGSAGLILQHRFF